jgi:hypothetical protein
MTEPTIAEMIEACERAANVATDGTEGTHLRDADPDYIVLRAAAALLREHQDGKWVPRGLTLTDEEMREAEQTPPTPAMYEAMRKIQNYWGCTCGTTAVCPIHGMQR